MARDLKYNSQPTDLDKLQRELGHGPSGGTFAPTEDDDDEDDGDEWLSASR